MSLFAVLRALILESPFVLASMGSFVVFVLNGREGLKTLFGMEKNENHA